MYIRIYICKRSIYIYIRIYMIYIYICIYIYVKGNPPCSIASFYFLNYLAYKRIPKVCPSVTGPQKLLAYCFHLSQIYVQILHMLSTAKGNATTPLNMKGSITAILLKCSHPLSDLLWLARFIPTNALHCTHVSLNIPRDDLTANCLDHLLHLICGFRFCQDVTWVLLARNLPDAESSCLVGLLSP